MTSEAATAHGGFSIPRREARTLGRLAFGLKSCTRDVHRACTMQPVAGERGVGQAATSLGVEARMSWLEMLLETFDRSKDDLARGLFAALPNHRYKNPRSLSAALGSHGRKPFDMLPLDWTDALVSVLDLADREALRDHAMRGTGVEGAERRRLQLHDLGEARWLDLGSEEPFPGIPREVFDPACWRNTWWHARSGAGRRLVAQWHRVRKTAKVIEADSLTEALLELPEDGSVYIVLSGRRASERLAADAWPDRPICVAAPSAPPGEQRSAESLWDRSEHSTDGGRQPKAVDWHPVETAPPEQWRDALIDWVAARVHPGGGFEASAARHLFEEQSLALACDTPGQVLMLCGLLDALGADKLRAASIDRILTVWITHVADRADVDPTVRTWLINEGPRLFRQMLVARLFESLETEIVSPERWIGWLGEREAPVDRRRARDLLSAAQAGDATSRAALDEMLKPGPEATLALLVDVRLLAREAGGIRVRARWIADLVERSCCHELMHDAPIDRLGLFAFARASQAMQAMHEHLMQGGSGLIERILTAVESAPTPHAIAALEGLFRAVGVSILCGMLMPDAHLRRRLWVAQMRIIGSCHTQPNSAHQRTLSWGGGQVSFWTEASIFPLAAMVIAEGLPDLPVPHPILNPWDWHEDDGLDTAQRRQHDIASLSFWSSGVQLRARWYDNVVDMMARWWSGRRVEWHVDSHGALFPVAFVDAVAEGSSPPEDHCTELALNQMARLAEQQRVPKDVLWGAFWHAQRRREPAWVPDSSWSDELVRDIWAAVPEEILTEDILNNWARGWGRRVPWNVLSESRSDVLLAHLERITWHERDPWTRVVPALSEEFVCRMAKAGVARATDLYSLNSAMWQRAPSAMESRLRASLAGSDHDGALSDWYAAPEPYRSQFEEPLLVAIEKAAPGTITHAKWRSWLHRRLHERSPHWERAFALLDRMTPPLEGAMTGRDVP